MLDLNALAGAKVNGINDQQAVIRTPGRARCSCHAVPQPGANLDMHDLHTARLVSFILLGADVDTGRACHPKRAFQIANSSLGARTTRCIESGLRCKTVVASRDDMLSSSSAHGQVWSREVAGARKKAQSLKRRF